MSLEFQQSFQPKRMSMPHGKGTHASKRTTAKKKPTMMAGGMAKKKKTKPKMTYGGMAKKKTGMMYGGMAKKRRAS